MKALDTVLYPLHRQLETPFRPLNYLTLAPLVPLTACIIPFAIVIDSALNRELCFTATPLKATGFSVLLIAFFTAKVAASALLCCYSLCLAPLALIFLLAWPADLMVAALATDTNAPGKFAQVTYESIKLPNKFKLLFSQQVETDPHLDFEVAKATFFNEQAELKSIPELQELVDQLLKITPLKAEEILNLGGKPTLKENWKELLRRASTDRIPKAKPLFCLFDAAYKKAITKPVRRQCFEGILPV